MRDSLDIKDEYFCVGNDFDCDQFTKDYFEYKQGQKDIIVKKQTQKSHGFLEKNRCKSVHSRYDFIWLKKSILFFTV